MNIPNQRYKARARAVVTALAVLLLLVVAGGAVGQSLSVPEEPPIAAAGLNVHFERCANCHGASGLGDGELAANLPNPPAAHASLAYLRAAVPSEMFDVITKGIIPQGMPPFGPESSDPLTDEQRWNLIAAIYSLGTAIESVGDGRDVYLENCQACHGEEGLGDGPDAEQNPGDLTSLAAGSLRWSSRPLEGTKPRAGSSAYSLTSMAWPRALIWSWPTGNGSPAATRSCHSTRSWPVIASVTGCST